MGEEGLGGKGGEFRGAEEVEDAADEVGAVGVGDGARGADAEESLIVVGEQDGVAEGWRR